MLLAQGQTHWVHVCLTLQLKSSVEIIL